MKRLAALVGVAFLMTMALLVRFQMMPGALAIPAEQDRVIRMSAESGEYLDTARLKMVTGVPLVASIARYGDMNRSTPDVAVWAEFASLVTGDGDRVDYHERRLAFDRHTAETVTCCDAYVDNDHQPRPQGLLYRWPFGARAVPYPVYDPLVGRAVTARFEGSETLRGVRVYRYGQRLVNERLREPGLMLPAGVLGLWGGRELPVSGYLDGTRTYWVEPASGLVVAQRDVLHKTYRTADGRGRVTAYRADLRTSADDEYWNASVAQRFRTWSTVVGTAVPLTLALAALGLLIWAVRRPAAKRASQPADT